MSTFVQPCTWFEMGPIALVNPGNIIAFSLGANHDGEVCGNEYVMNAYAGFGTTYDTTVRFSQCSIKEFKSTLSQ